MTDGIHLIKATWIPLLGLVNHQDIRSCLISHFLIVMPQLWLQKNHTWSAIWLIQSRCRIVSSLWVVHQEHLEGSVIFNFWTHSSIGILPCNILSIKKETLEGSFLCQIIATVKELFWCLLKFCQADLQVKTPFGSTVHISQSSVPSWISIPMI